MKKIESFEKIKLRESGMRGSQEHEIVMKGAAAEVTRYLFRYSRAGEERITDKRAEVSEEAVLKLLNSCGVLSWNGFHGAHPRGVRDGIMFSLNATVNGGVTLRAEGSENFPKRYRDFTDGLNDLLSSEKSEVTP